MKKRAIYLLSLVLLVTVGCADQNFDWELAHNNPMKKYEATFKSIFGQIHPQQRWDLSWNTVIASTRATGGASDLVSISKTYPKSAEEEAKKTLGNGINNTSLGERYSILSKGKFLLCPVWQGPHECDYYLVIQGVDPVTNKEIIKYIITPTELTNQIGTGNGSSAKGWEIPCPAGMEIQVYLAYKEGDNYIGGITLPDGSPSSLQGTGKFKGNSVLKDGYTSCILLDGPKSHDKDYNDLMLMLCTINGSASDPESPEVITHETSLTFDVSKRYMVEDLGSSAKSDVDYNDIVVDFRQKWTTKYTLDANYNELSTETTIDAQDVTVRALGGTLDFKLFVDGDNGSEMVFEKSTAGPNSTFPMIFKPGLTKLDVKTMYNTGASDDGMKGIQDDTYDLESYICKFTGSAGHFIQGWNNLTNNIRIVMVDNRDSSSNAGNVYELKFPEAGEVPAIIAFDVTKHWRLERDGIENSAWFTTNAND